MRRKTISRPFEIKSVEEDEKTGLARFKGYASVFGEQDFGGDIVMRGAFAKSIARKGPQGIPVLWQHKQDTPIGVHDVIEEDGTGLYIEGLLVMGVQKADEARLLAKAKAISGISIGYIPEDVRPGKKKGTNELHVVDLWENSLVTFPMLDIARVTDMKSVPELKTIREVEEHLREVGGYSAHEAKAIISCIKADRQQRDVAEKATGIDYAKLRTILNS